MTTSPTPASPNTPSTHGGARPGAGRKPHALKYEHSIQSAHERCAARLPRTLDELELLAQGVPVTRERWVAAGTLTIGQGANRRPAFPDLPPEQLVLVARTTTNAKPDPRAVLYLADRVLGRLTSSDNTLIEELVSAELQFFIQKINARFSPQLAHLIFTTLSTPEDLPTPIDIPSSPDQDAPHTIPDEDDLAQQTPDIDINAPSTKNIRDENISDEDISDEDIQEQDPLPPKQPSHDAHQKPTIGQDVSAKKEAAPNPPLPNRAPLPSQAKGSPRPPAKTPSAPRTLSSATPLPDPEPDLLYSITPPR